MTTANTTATTALPTGTWRLDPAQTTVTVSVKKLGLITVHGTLAVTSGLIDIDANQQVTSVEVIADASSYTSGNDKRDEHVRSADFLDADTFSELVFRTGTVSAAGAGYVADGAVTVKGQTSALSVEITDVEASGERASFVANATIDRNAIGVDKMPSFVIGRELQLSVTAAAVVDPS